MASVSSPACQATSPVGAADVGMVSLEGAPVSMPLLPLLSLSVIGRWAEPCTGSCPQVLAELPTSLEYMDFKERTRTRRNLLSPSY